MMRNIVVEMKRFGVSVFDIQRLITCSERTVYNKLNGKTDFTYSEVKKIRDNLFPGFAIDYLFESPPDTKKGA